MPQTKQKNMELSIIIPAYHEEENLRIILPRLMLVLNELGMKHEVRVIDTMEPLDNTKAVCFSNAAIYINRENGNNYGDAIKTGIKYALGEFIIMMDADGSHSPEFVAELYAHKDNNDVVIASRYIKGGFTDNSTVLILMSRVLNVVYSLVLSLNCKDVSNSFKLYRGALLKQLNLNSKNFDIVEEILFKLKRIKPNLKMKEIPFCFKKRTMGYTKRNLFLFILSYIYTIFKLRFGK